jgi:hypothetical protein
MAHAEQHPEGEPLRSGREEWRIAVVIRGWLHETRRIPSAAPASDSATQGLRPSIGVPRERVDGLEGLGSPRLELREVGRTLPDDELRAPRVGQVPHRRPRMIQGSDGIPIADDDEGAGGDEGSAPKRSADAGDVEVLEAALRKP